MKKFLVLIMIILSSNMFLKVNGQQNNLTIDELLRHYNKNDLIKIATSCENYERERLGEQGLIGGLHDYINSLSEDKIISIIADFGKQNPELQSIEKLKQISNLTTPIEATNLDEYLNNLSRFDLISLALKTEEYERRKSGKRVYGGLHDYVDRLDSQDIVTIIKKFSEKYPEFNSLDGLRNFNNDKSNNMTLEKFEEKLNGMLEDKLTRIALALDSYDRKHSNNVKLGGIHDYIRFLDKKAIITIILNFARKWPEVMNENFLDSNLMGSNTMILGGIEDYLRNFNEFDLKKLALAAEQYERNTKGVILLGGLHDYIDTLNKDEVYNIVVKYIQKYPELRKPGYLEKLAKLPKGGLKMQLENYSDEDLKKLCLALEAYDRKQRKINLIGGIHDYIQSASREAALNYASKIVSMYPELSEEGNLEKLVKRNYLEVLA